MKNERRVPAGRFKAECLALLDRVAITGEPIVVTKRGRPVARIVPLEEDRGAALLGSVQELGDVVAPLGEPWTSK